jgi:uncharacterized protein with HEPN domain
MERQRAKRLREALAAASLIHTMIQHQTLDGYLADEWFRAAVERKLEIIGEALNSVRRMDPEVDQRLPTIHEWPALRNVLSHVYFQIDHVVIWETATREVPELIAMLNTLLAVDGNEEERSSR